MVKKAKKTTNLHDMWKDLPPADKLVFDMPGSNQVGNLSQLGQQVAEVFKDYKEHATTNLVKMAVLADGVRQANLNQRKTYSDAFHTWYEKFNMDKVFGSKSNFSKYADAGVVITKFKSKLEDKFAQLPLKISVLYVISDMTDDELDHALTDHYIKDPKDHRSIKTKSKKPQPVINPTATAASISSWLKKWRNPPVPSTEKRRVPFLMIKADATVFDFDKKGNPTGATSIADLERIYQKLETALKGEEAHVLADFKFFDIKQGQEKRHLAALDKSKKKSKRT